MKFFYIIVTSHNNMLGYGITGNPSRRLQSYISHSAVEQEFVKLYCGDDLAIIELEKYVKNQWKPFSKTLNDWVLEWIEPSSNLTVADMVDLVDDKIMNHPLSVKKVREQFLPFNAYSGNTDICEENISYSPETYLVTVKKSRQSQKKKL